MVFCPATVCFSVLLFIYIYILLARPGPLPLEKDNYVFWAFVFSEKDNYLEKDTVPLPYKKFVFSNQTLTISCIFEAGTVQTLTIV